MSEQRDMVRELAEKCCAALLDAAERGTSETASVERMIREELRELLDAAETTCGTIGGAQANAVHRLAAQLKVEAKKPEMKAWFKTWDRDTKRLTK